MNAHGRFHDRVAVVTGGASGIGLAIVRRLLEEGARVLATDINADTLDALRRDEGDAVATYLADVRNEVDVAAMVQAAGDTFGRLDLGFNAAGLGAPGEITELTEENWDLVLDVCLKGAFLSVKHEARAMKAHGRGGAIVNIASLNCHVPMFRNNFV